jgi:hypothetical protein
MNTPPDYDTLKVIAHQATQLLRLTTTCSQQEVAIRALQAQMRDAEGRKAEEVAGLQKRIDELQERQRARVRGRAGQVQT